jgi:dTDP-3-amino-3,4,6-trideoxy-alpha-D-glucose transaminase
MILGDEVKDFENKLAHYWGLPFAVGCANGLDALEIALRCKGLQAGEKVLTTPLSAFASALAIIRAGGIPVFADVDTSGLIDITVCKKILEQSEDIRYFVPVHLYGHAISYHSLIELKSQFNLHIIEDCAQAIGATSSGKMVGTASGIAATSFYPTKNLGCMGDGGAILMSDANTYEHAKSLRDYGQTAKYVHTHLGMNSRLDEIQAAILKSALLPKLQEFTDHRQKIAHSYLTHIHHPLIKIPTPPADSKSVWHLFPILVTENRSGLQQHFSRLGIQSSIHYPGLISEQSALVNQQEKFIVASELTQAKYFVEHELSLPIHPFLLQDDIERVIAACNSWQGD